MQASCAKSVSTKPFSHFLYVIHENFVAQNFTVYSVNCAYGLSDKGLNEAQIETQHNG